MNTDQNTITSIESQLKTIILEKYGSIRNFSKQSGIPYSTINNIFERGFDSLGIGTAIKICDCLNVDIDGVARGVLQYRMGREAPMVISSEEMLWLLYFRSLSDKEKDEKLNALPDDILPHLYWHIDTADNDVQNDTNPAKTEIRCKGVVSNYPEIKKWPQTAIKKNDINNSMPEDEMNVLNKYRKLHKKNKDSVLNFIEFSLAQQHENPKQNTKNNAG